jgi:predicted PurR-regulated permease PerM
MNQDMVNKTTLALMAIGISALFFSMIQKFLMVIFLAGLFSALTRPVFRRFNIIYKGNKYLASATTLVLMIFVVMIPLLFLVGIVVAQAIDVGQSITPWVKQTLNEPGQISSYLEKLPFFGELEPYREPILKKAGELVGYVSKLIAGGLSSATFGTVYFVFLSFVFLYTMYFFQLDGDKLMKKILYYLPLDSADESVMLKKFTSVTRATLKGTMLIGMLQGGLAGTAFAIAGLDNAVFWGTVMAVLSIIPSVGSAMIWIPAAIILMVQGSVAGGIGLIVFCGLVVGSLDNVLRPILVGKDTKMHELMIFFGTLGGIMMFGITGIFIGPLIASLFITVWELYGIAFSDYLPEVYSRKVSTEARNAVTDNKTDDYHGN